jgi:HTH-type transcriptional regulator/antitoxin HigA
METRPIKNDDDYEAALAEIERLFDAAPGTPESERLEALVKVVEAYEDQNYDLPLPDPVEAIKYYAESRGLSLSDEELASLADELFQKLDKREEELLWSQFSLAQAMRGMEDEDGPVYSRDDLKEEWLTEAQRRAKELDAGTVQPIPAEEVRRKVRALLGLD